VRRIEREPAIEEALAREIVVDPEHVGRARRLGEHGQLVARDPRRGDQEVPERRVGGEPPASASNVAHRRSFSNAAW
jgi:hypothetical protein